MKVLQINKLYYPWVGGVERVVQDIAEGLKDKVNVKVLVCQPKGKGKKDVINGIEVLRAGSLGICLSMPISISFPFLLKRLSKDVDILHFHMPFPLGDISYLLAANPKAKIVVWWHSDIIKQKHLLVVYRPFLLKFLKRADVIMVATPRHIESSLLLKEFREKCEVIPFGIDMARYHLSDTIHTKAEAIRLKHGTKIILFIGRLIYYKGVEFLIKAMQFIDGKLIIVGDGPLKDSLVNLANEIGVKDRVFFTGKIEDDADMPAYLYACDVFVLPSVANSEAFGLVQVEAMACGKPVVNTNLLTGVPYVSVDGETGITVPPKDSYALAKAINLLLSDADLRQRYGRNALIRVEKEFSMGVMIKRILSVYERLMLRNASGSVNNFI